MNEEQLGKQIAYSIERIAPYDEEAALEAQRHSDRLTKPPGSLGKLEEMSCRLAGIGGGLWPSLDKKAVVVMAADHGVCEEGVSAFPQEVTAQMMNNFLQGGAAVNVLAKQAGADVFCVDMGVKSDLDVNIDHPRLLRRKVMHGTANMVKQPAMSREQMQQAVLAGIQIAEDLAEQGYQLFATGEMGIGNTTASAALASMLTGLPPEQTAGRGTGIDDSGWLHKVDVIRRAVELHEPACEDVFDVLERVGGLEIAGMAGFMIGAAIRRVPVVIDGFISSVAALVAVRMSERVRSYVIASHLSQEQGHRKVLEALELSPVIHLDMRLGEGTGAVLCFSIVEAALKLMQEMATFESAGISKE
ncbi:nicotinate-nucleotide--dimethylbenzimidazole phosphoribosyltransferase [Paenibacillus sp. NPDC058071]|uniref:nicotinate-nucleotide--dimethylbenzimidazole phosphoribosyltransferase n=1 Tax=Paenibacillus sp. NPDC058071 TaxID=3346326 RepID=UPI0036D8813D